MSENLGAGTPAVGSQAPTFSLPDTHGATLGSGHLYGSTALLVFFPFAFSPICAGELEEIRDRSTELAELNVRVVTVSCDSQFALRAWSDIEGFDFDLLSDFWPHGQVSKDFGVFDSRRGLPLRGSFLLDAESTVRWKVINDAGQPRRVDDYLAAASQL